MRSSRIPSPSREMLCSLLLALSGSPSQAESSDALTVISPNGRLQLVFALQDFPDGAACPTYQVRFDGSPVLAPSRLGLELTGTSLRSNFTVRASRRATHNTVWHPVAAERNAVRDHYHELTVQLARHDQPHRLLHLAFRAYDEGIAFALTVPQQLGLASARVQRELSEFRFPGDPTAWATYSAQGEYRKTPLSAIQPGCERPLVLQLNDHLYAALAEARLVDYARMKFAPLPDTPPALTSQLDGEVIAPLPLTTPWRVVLVATSPGQLLENNFLLLNLNEPCALTDTSWIRPGKVIREVTLTTSGGKACVDFAVRQGLQYVEYDAGWYGHEYDDAADATTVTVDPRRSRGPLDLPEVIRYARERDIGIILYVNRRALEQQLDTLLPLYRSWGIRGIKYGFVNVGSQDWTRWLHHAIRQAADHQLMVDVHDEYRPTGYSRTYPNLLTAEGIRGDEARPSAEQTLITLFTRMLAGPADNTVCYQDRRVSELWSPGFQLAKPVCLFSPWQFLFWYDRPDTVPPNPGLEFYRTLPTVWDETRVLQGAIGEYAVVARRYGDEWFVGCLNAGPPRTLELPLGFLDRDRNYLALCYEDTPAQAASPPGTVTVRQLSATATTFVTLALPSPGGAALHLRPHAAP